MMPDDSDRELRARFARLRTEEGEASGAFRVPGRAEPRREPRRLPYRLPATLAAAAVIVVAALSLVDRESRAPRSDVEHRAGPLPSLAMDPPAFVSGSVRRIPLQLAWRTPTDVLLDTPGSELLRDLPSLGVSILGDLHAPAPPRPARDRPSADSTSSRANTSRSST